MIKKVLQGIYEGKTLAQISQELDMEYSALMGMIQQLIRMGYVEAVERDSSQVKFCKSCPLYKVCSKNGPKIYFLTKKGLKTIK